MPIFQGMNKDKILSFLSKIDYSTPEGKANYEKALDIFDKGSKRFEEIMDQVDKAFDNIDNKTPAPNDARSLYDIM